MPAAIAPASKSVTRSRRFIPYLLLDLGQLPALTVVASARDDNRCPKTARGPFRGLSCRAEIRFALRRADRVRLVTCVQVTAVHRGQDHGPRGETRIRVARVDLDVAVPVRDV